MKTYKIKSSVEEALKDILVPEEKIEKIFDVLPLDYKPQNLLSARIYLTKSRLLVTFDNILEVYNLADLSLAFNEVAPKFKLVNIYLLEGNFDLSTSLEKRVADIRNSENLTMFSIQEGNSVSKEFLLRKLYKLEPGFKTWAFGQSIINMKNIVANRGVDEMLNGYYTTFDSNLFMNAIYSFIGFFLVKAVSVTYFPRIADTILDLIFVLLLGYIVYKMVMHANGALERYKKVYLSYQN